MLPTFVSILLLSVVGSLGQDDCEPVPPHMQQGGQCCNFPDFRSAMKSNTNMHTAAHKCMSEAGIKKPDGPPSGGSPPPRPDEAVFEDSDGNMIENEVKTFFVAPFTGDFAAPAAAAFEKCFASSKAAEQSATSTCKSGPNKLHKCFHREMFQTCPASQWTESDACTQAKEKLNRCPNLMPPMGRGPKHHRH